MSEMPTLGVLGGGFDAPPPLRGAADVLTPMRGSSDFTPMRGRAALRGLPRRRKKSGVAALLAGAAVRAVLVVALPVAVVVWILYSPYFRIESVDVDGGARVSAAWVRGELQPLVGRHVLAVSLEAVRRRLSAHPWVASVELRRELPHRLRVAVVERQPAALLRTDEGYLFLDRAGQPIAACPPDAPALVDRRHRLLVLRDRFPRSMATGTLEAGPVPVQAALDLVEELRHAQPAWAVAAAEVQILGEGDYRVQTAALPYPLLLKAGAVAEAVANLQRALPEIGRRYASIDEIDLRQPRRLVVRPAAHASLHETKPATPAAPPSTHSQPSPSATTR